jgi:hypothetical protein
MEAEEDHGQQHCLLKGTAILRQLNTYAIALIFRYFQPFLLYLAI